MAALTPVHWETVTDELRTILEHVGRQSFADRFYLAGGTGGDVASVLDIGLMKLDAIISRGSRKDFYDLFSFCAA